MASYNSFIFAGHGKSERTGIYDPGAVNGSITEYNLVTEISKAAQKYLSKTGLKIHYDNNNFSDEDLAGNTYTARCGISIHINAGGGKGTEVYVPSKEKYLNSDFELVNAISKELGIPNRGVKSRDYSSGRTVNRTNGVALGYTDYYKEIRDAWSRGISLSLIEVGFIDTSDLNKIMDNIDEVGFLIAKYIAGVCGKTLTETDIPTKPTKPPTSSNTTYYRVVAGSFRDRQNAEERVKELKKKGYSGVFIDIYKP